MTINTIELDNLLAQARAQIDLRRKLRKLEQEQQEQADRALNESILDALERLLPALLIQHARWVVDSQASTINNAQVQLDPDDLQLAPIVFELCRRSHEHEWGLRTRDRINGNPTGYRVSLGWRVVWDEVGDAGWYAQPDPWGHQEHTKDIVEAVSYAIEGWDAYNDACQRVAALNLSDERPKAPAPHRKSPGKRLLEALHDYIEAGNDNS